MARAMRGTQTLFVKNILKIWYIATNNAKIENPDPKIRIQRSI